jgi:hypothetical protein
MTYAKETSMVAPECYFVATIFGFGCVSHKTSLGSWGLK